jgi:hypothetical protein
MVFAVRSRLSIETKRDSPIGPATQEKRTFALAQNVPSVMPAAGSGRVILMLPDIARGNDFSVQLVELAPGTLVIVDV